VKAESKALVDELEEKIKQHRATLDENDLSVVKDGYNPDAADANAVAGGEAVKVEGAAPGEGGGGGGKTKPPARGRAPAKGKTAAKPAANKNVCHVSLAFVLLVSFVYLFGCLSRLVFYNI
jgi:hypothetical protein